MPVRIRAGIHPRMAGIKEALVTGASGFVGSHVSRLLLERGWRVRVFVRSTSPLFHLQEFPTQVFRGDIQDVAALRAAMRGVGTVFHVTGHVSFQRRERAEIERVNVGGTQAVLEAVTASDVETLIVTSSVSLS